MCIRDSVISVNRLGEDYAFLSNAVPLTASGSEADENWMVKLSSFCLLYTSHPCIVKAEMVGLAQRKDCGEHCRDSVRFYWTTEVSDYSALCERKYPLTRQIIILYRRLPIVFRNTQYFINGWLRSRLFCFFGKEWFPWRSTSVSYTHLDVYKRQACQ